MNRYNSGDMDDGHSHLRLRLGILMYLQYAVPGAFLPLQTTWLTQLGFTPLEIGAVGATQAVAALTATWVAGQVADRWLPAERCLALATFLCGAFLWLLPELKTPLPVFSACLGAWLMLVPATTLGTALCFTHLRNPERDFGPVRLWGTVGWVMSGWVLGGWFSLPSGAWVNELVGRSADLGDIFRLGAIMALLWSAYSWTLPHTPPARQAVARFAPLQALGLLRQRDFAIYFLCTFGVTMTLPFTVQVTPLLLEALGIPKEWLAPTLTLAQSMEIVSLALLPVILARLGMRSTMRLGLGSWLLALAILALGEPTWLVVSSLALNGLCICGYLVAGQVFVNSRARGDIRASVQGLFAFVNGVGLLIGNLMVGVVREAVDQAFAPTFAVAAALTGILFVVFQIGFPQEGASNPPSVRSDD